MNIIPVVIDFETTGTDIAVDSICQMAAVMADFNSEPTKAVTLLSMLTNPGMAIPAGAQEIHGISDADVYWSTPVVWGLRHMDMMLKALSKTGQVVLCGQNSQRFDIPMADRILPEAGFRDYPMIDSYTIALREFPSMPHKLGEFFSWYLEEEAIDAHDAAADCHMCARIIGKYIKDRGVGALELAEELTQPKVLETFPFGKSKGMPVSEIPKSYFRWCRNNFTDAHADIEATICSVLGCEA